MKQSKVEPSPKVSPVATQENTQTADVVVNEKPRSSKKLRLLTFLMSCLAVSGFVAAGIIYFQYSNLQNKLSLASTPTLVDETKVLTARISQVLLLPSDELPTVATVSDPEKLKDQAFFANSMTGDKVLIYSKSQKAILYRPSSGQIIEVAPLGDNQVN